MSLARHALLILILTALVVGAALLMGCDKTQIKDEAKVTDAASASTSERKTEADKATKETRTEGAVRTVTVETETVTVPTESVCPGPLCPFPAEYWAPPTSSTLLYRPPQALAPLPTSTPVAESPAPRRARPVLPPTVTISKRTETTIEKGAVVAVKESVASRSTDTVSASTSTSKATDNIHEKKEIDLGGLSWKAWLAIVLVLCLALWLGYKAIPKLPFSR